MSRSGARTWIRASWRGSPRSLPDIPEWTYFGWMPCFAGSFFMRRSSAPSLLTGRRYSSASSFDLGAQGVPALEQTAHGVAGEGMEPVGLFRPRMVRVHDRAQPDVPHFEVLEPGRVEALDVILVPVRGDDEVEPLLSGGVARWQQVLGQVAEGVTEERFRGSLATAVDQDVESIRTFRDADVEAVATTDVVGANQELRSHRRGPSVSEGWGSSERLRCGERRKRTVPSARSVVRGGM
jgi:hypothetical protein